MSKPNVGKKKVPGPHNIKKHQPKKEYSLRSKHNIKTATVSEISHSGERAQHTLNEERLISGQSKNPSVFAKPNNPNLKANDGNKYYHANSQVVRYGYDHQADNQYVNGYDHADYQCSGNVIIGLMISMVDVQVIKQTMKDMGSVDAPVAMRDTIFIVMAATYIVNTSEEIIRTTLTRISQNKTNSLERVV